MQKLNLNFAKHLFDEILMIFSTLQIIPFIYTMY
jgi:hypothetical protein